MIDKNLTLNDKKITLIDSLNEMIKKRPKISNNVGIILQYLLTMGETTEIISLMKKHINSINDKNSFHELQKLNLDLAYENDELQKLECLVNYIPIKKIEITIDNDDITIKEF